MTSSQLRNEELPEERSHVVPASTIPSEKRDVDETVLLKISDVKKQQCIVVEKKKMDQKLGDSFMGYKLKIDDGSDRIYKEKDSAGNETEWIAQNRLELA